MIGHRIGLIVLIATIVVALIWTLMAQIQPQPSESVITKVKWIASSYGSGVGYEIYSWTDNEAWASIYLEAENERIPFGNIYCSKTDDEWEIKSFSHWPAPSPSRALTIIDYKIKTGTVSTPKFSYLEYFIPVVKNSSRWPAFVAFVELKLENSTNRYGNSYSTVGRDIGGIVSPWETIEVEWGGGAKTLIGWYELDNLPPTTKLLRMDSLEGKTFEVTITLKDGEGAVLAENVFICTF
jgi:hypothetical protein